MFKEEDIEFIRNLERVLTEDFKMFMMEFGVPDHPQVRIKWYEGLLKGAKEDPIDDYILQKLAVTMIENQILKAKAEMLENVIKNPTFKINPN